MDIQHAVADPWAGDATGTPGAALHDEVRAVLAFTWIAQGRTLEAAALALETLAPHLTRYNRSMAANARALRARTQA